MTMNKARQIKIILLLAGYLFAVLGHLCLLRSAAVTSAPAALINTAVADKLQDKSGRNGIKLKKIAKTVINRGVLPQNSKVFSQLYVATLLHKVSFRMLHSSRPAVNAVALTDLPVKRSFHLRI